MIPSYASGELVWDTTEASPQFLMMCRICIAVLERTA